MTKISQIYEKSLNVAIVLCQITNVAFFARFYMSCYFMSQTV